MALNAGSIEIKLFASIAKLQNDMDKASKHIDSFSKRTEATIQRTGNAFKGLFAGITVNTIARLADEYKKFDSQLKLATTTVEDYNKAYSNVIRIGRTSMSDIGAIGVLYARLTNNLREYGTTQQEVSDITESVSLALRVSNATAQETNSVMLQLSQSFGSGRINGQEFLAVMEGAPMLMRQLAKSIGIPFGELKKLSEQGQLTADLLKKAWTDPVFLDLLRTQVKEVGTISSSYTVLVNNLKQYIGEADKATGASKAIMQAITLLADNLNTLATVALVAVIAKTGQFVAGVYASIKASQLRQIELVKETVILERKAAAEAKATAIQAAALINNAKATTMWAARNSAAFTENAAVMAGVAARTTSAAKAMGAFRTALMFLGGPIGATITILGTLALAFASFGKKSAGEMEELLRITKELNEELSKTPEKIIAKSASSLDNLAKVREQLEKDLARAQRGTIDFSTGQIFIDEQEIKRIQGLLDASLIRYQELTNARIDGENKVKQAVDESANATKALRDANIKFLSEQIKEQEDLIKLAKESNLSEMDKLAIIADAQKKINDLTGATKALKAEEKASAKAAKLEREEQLKWFEARQEAADEWIKSIKESRKEALSSAMQENKAIQEQIDAVNKGIEIALNGEEGYRRLEMARLNDALATAQQTVSQGKLNGLTGEALDYAEEYIEYLREQIKLRTELNEREAIEKNLKDAAEAQKKAAEESKKAWEKAEEDKRKEFEKTVDTIDKIFAEGFADMVNGGKDTWKSFTQSLITTFKTTVVNEIYKLLLRPFVVKIIASVAGITGLGGAGSAAAEGLGGASSGGVLGTIKQSLDALNSNVVGSIQNLGVFISDGMGGIRDTIGGFIGQYSSTIASALPYAASFMKLVQGDFKGAAFTAAGTAIGAAVGGPVGAAIGSVLGNVVGGLFGGSGERFKQVFQTGKSTFDGSQFTQTKGVDVRAGAGVQTALSGIQQTFSRNLFAILDEFDVAAKITTNIYARLRRTSGDTATKFSAKLGGKNILSAMESFATDGDFAKGVKELGKKVLGPLLRKAIMASDLSEGIKGLFKGFKKPQQIADLINATINLNKSADGLNERFGLTTDQAAKVAKELGLTGKELIAFVNEFAALAGSFNTVGQTIVAIRTSLESFYGGALPASLKDFDNALKNIDTTTQEGIKTFSKLFAMRSDFIEFQAALDGLKGSVRAALFTIVSEQEQIQMKQQDLVRVFDEFGQTLPSSVNDLIALGKSIDYTTEEGLNLAAAFPTLVAAFKDTQDAIDAYEQRLQAERERAAQDAERERERILSERKRQAESALSESQSLFDLARRNLERAFEAERSRLQGIIDNVDVIRSKLQQAFDTKKSGLEDTISKFRSFGDSIREFRRSLVSGIGSNQDPLTLARLRFEQISASALTGDEKALSELQGVSNEYLSVLQNYSSDFLDYQRAFSTVSQTLLQVENSTYSTVSVAELQLEALKAQVGSLLSVEEATLSVEEGISQLIAAQNLAASAQDQMTALNTQQNSLLQTLNESVLSVAQAIKEFLAAQKNLIRAENVVAQFAAGGVFTNGIVQRPTSFGMGMMGEAGPEAIMPLTSVNGRLGVSANNSEIVEQLEIIGEKISRLEAVQIATAQNTGKVARIIERADNGDSLNVVVTTL